MYCQNCGAEINDKAVVCIKCGVPVRPVVQTSHSTEFNEWLVALLLCVFLGCFGAHRFYTKSYGIAVAQLLLGIFTFGLISEIWALVDLVLILSGSYTTGDGRKLTQN